MSDAVKIAIIVSIAPTLMAFIAFLKLHTQVKGVHRDLNSRLDQWRDDAKSDKDNAVKSAYAAGASDTREAATELEKQKRERM